MLWMALIACAEPITEVQMTGQVLTLDGVSYRYADGGFTLHAPDLLVMGPEQLQRRCAKTIATSRFVLRV